MGKYIWDFSKPGFEKLRNNVKFNERLEPGACFAMCVNTAEVMTRHQRDHGKVLPIAATELEPAKWHILQSAYEINSRKWKGRTDFLADLITAQRLEITGLVPAARNEGDFSTPVQVVTDIAGTTIFGISSPPDPSGAGGGGHALLWHRDDGNREFLYVDPNAGLLQFQSVHEARTEILRMLNRHYSDISKVYTAYTVRAA
jgi:hypothetical protein